MLEIVIIIFSDFLVDVLVKINLLHYLIIKLIGKIFYTHPKNNHVIFKIVEYFSPYFSPLKKAFILDLINEKLTCLLLEKRGIVAFCLSIKLPLIFPLL